MESKYTKLIEELREHVSDYDCGKTQNFREVFDDCVHAADAIETLSRTVNAYAKANAELAAWKANAQDWMQKVAEEKEENRAADVCVAEKAPAPDVYYICDRRACCCCDPCCQYTCDPSHARHFENEGGDLFEKAVNR